MGSFVVSFSTVNYRVFRTVYIVCLLNLFFLVSDQKPGSYSLETLTCSRESSVFRIKVALVSDVKMGCNQGGFNYRGLGGRQSWTRPSMNRNNHVSTPETDAGKVQNVALVHFRVKRLQSSTSEKLMPDVTFSSEAVQN